MSEKIKLLIIGDGVTPTGFSRVLHSVAKNLSLDIYDISWLAVNYFGDPHIYPNYTIYPATGGEHQDAYGFSKLSFVLGTVKPDVIFLLNDIWIIDAYLDALKQIYQGKEKPKIVVYFPVDAEDHQPEWYRHVDYVDSMYTYTEFGKRVAEKACPDTRFRVAPHGTDNSMFYKIEDRTKEEIRAELFPKYPDLWSEDLFYILNGNRNQPRKRLDVTLRAFAMFAEGKDDVKLYLHTGMVDAHVHIPALVKTLGIVDKLTISSTYSGVQKASVEKLNKIYNACNVGVNTCVGEGWGLVNNEHAITGAPQIVPNHSALADIYADCGVLVDPIMDFTLDTVPTTGKLCRPDDIAEGMQLLYGDRELLADLSKKSIAKFTSEKYTWEYVASIFDKRIRELVG